MFQNYKTKTLKKRYFIRNYCSPGINSDFNGICAGCRAAGCIWLIRLTAPDSCIQSDYFIAAVCIWCRCNTGGTGRCDTGFTWHCNRLRRSNQAGAGHYAGDCRVASAVLHRARRQAGELHLNAGYGRIYFRYRLYDYFNAGGKAVWRFGRHGRTFVLIAHILNQLQYFNLLSAVLGIGTIVIIFNSKKSMSRSFQCRWY